ncbi:MAG: hypothetical protein EOM69_10565 [Clostridia bacterium]|nr:hypothetical protein [Clostridia bacterium]
MRNGNFKSALSRLIPLRRADFLLLLGAPLLSLILLESFARWSLTDALCWALRRPWLFIRNGLLLACLFTVAHAFRSYRVRGALSLFLCAFFAALGLAEHYKLIYRFEPVLLSDLSMVGNLGDTVQGLHFSINFWPLIAVCALAAALGTLCWLRWKEKRRERSVLLPVIAALLLIALPFTMTFGSAGHDEGTDLAAHAR